MTPVCDIVIPIWNQREATRDCLESILWSTPEPVRLILIDNGSADPTREFLERFKRDAPVPVELIRNPKNEGFIRGTNQGIRAARAPWVCLLNNDTLVTPGWMAEMLKVASLPGVGLVNPTSNSLGFHPGNLSLKEYAASLKEQSGRHTELTTALGFCLLAPRSLFETVGLLEESFGMGYFEDDDLSRRARRAGFQCVRACAAYVHHRENISFRLMPQWKRRFRENRKRFEEKWGRRLRILWQGPVDTETALHLSSQGHWLTFIDLGEGLPPQLAGRAQVSTLKLGDNWRLRATLRLLLKRKKPFNLVISRDPAWSGWIRRLRWLHRAQLLDTQTPERAILEQCLALSATSSS